MTYCDNNDVLFERENLYCTVRGLFELKLSYELVTETEFS